MKRLTKWTKKKMKYQKRFYINIRRYPWKATRSGPKTIPMMLVLNRSEHRKLKSMRWRNIFPAFKAVNVHYYRVWLEDSDGFCCPWRVVRNGPAVLDAIHDFVKSFSVRKWDEMKREAENKEEPRKEITYGETGSVYSKSDESGNPSSDSTESPPASDGLY